MLATDRDPPSLLHAPEDAAGYVLADTEEGLELTGADLALGVDVFEHRGLDLLVPRRLVRYRLGAAGERGDSLPAAVAVEARRRRRILAPDRPGEVALLRQ